MFKDKKWYDSVLKKPCFVICYQKLKKNLNSCMKYERLTDVSQFKIRMKFSNHSF